MVCLTDALRNIVLKPYILFFDVDDVLVDTTQSFAQAVIKAARRYMEEQNLKAGEGLLEKAKAIKRCPGFNDDWDTAEALTLFLIQQRGPSPLRLSQFLTELKDQGGCQAIRQWIAAQRPDQRDWLGARYDSERVRRLAMAFYGGPSYCQTLFGFEACDFVDEGAVTQESLLVDPKRLKRVPVPWFIYTGRSSLEMKPVFEKMNLPEPSHLFCAGSGGPVKPDPSPLVEMVNRNNAQGVILVGDNPDDRETVVRFRRARPDILSAFVRVEGGGSPYDSEDSSVENVNQFLDLIL
jgi:phosphoglycolate phosphatase-like HAD superfamily hydrolase